ncbi:DinB family protein [Agriterribacter sp.]|uniref:DinB family protein n=1 Tax=Agriterribacter sp. TaxID=2821509 RepID=UPI002B569B46|nr:DinB family protein [Agriterribacter sp.]HTN05350.1 DinB family protein [Agriterribacter sp.]
MRPLPSDYAPFYETYVSLVKSDDIKQALSATLPDIENFLQSIPENKSDYAYAENKWTVKQVLQHGIDSERVFAYRAMCIARGEKQPLPSFDENLYAENATVQHRSLQGLKEELLLQRKSSISLFEQFTGNMLQASGIASGKPITVLSLGYIIAGHWQHHQQILAERYLG